MGPVASLPVTGWHGAGRKGVGLNGPGSRVGAGRRRGHPRDHLRGTARRHRSRRALNSCALGTLPSRAQDSSWKARSGWRPPACPDDLGSGCGLEEPAVLVWPSKFLKRLVADARQFGLQLVGEAEVFPSQVAAAGRVLAALVP